MEADVTTTGSRLVYENRWMRIREDAIRRRDGSAGIYGVIEKVDFVTVAAVDEAGRVHLVEQFRYPVQARCWELPQGMWEAAPETSHLDLARAELREETGLVAAEMAYAGHLLLAPGLCTQGYHVYRATGLTQGPSALEVSEQDLVTRAVPLPELEAMLRDGTIKDATTHAAFGLLRLKGLL
jgi:ADP-ribose pyrophosphatase